jgi:UV DNA damage repair endonuclease
MIICDYCGDPITDSIATQLAVVGTTTTEPPLRLDIHPECLPPFQTDAKKIKGKRPVKP